MIPTKENIIKFNEEKRIKNNKPKVHTKIANTFIENAIVKSNITALKTIYYLSTVLSAVDMKNMRDNKVVGICVDKREMLKYMEISAPTLIKTIKQMQQTSITFIDEEDGVIEGISLLPRYKFIPNKNIIEIDIYMFVLLK